MSFVREQRIRKPRFGALALLVTCVSIPAAARQSSPANAAAKPATAKSATTSQSAQKPGAPQSAGAAKSASTAHTAAGVHHSRRKKSTRVRGQKKIDPERARTIQEALIREHYLSGEPTGTWNQASEDAMRRYQSDHGWQTVEVPDSRALISLGLGPSKDHLLNPESAMTTGPEEHPSASPAQPQQNSPTPSLTESPKSVDPAKPQ